VPTADTPTEDHPDNEVRRVQVRDVEIAYETFGDPADPALLLVMGLGTQMLAWPDEMCSMLADAGHHVIRYDNRDVGLSTHLDHPVPKLSDMVLKRGNPYTITDMADDAFGLLDALGIDRFHLVGASMGGFISQTIALAQPERVRTLTLIMTSTGSRRVGRPTPSVMRRLAVQDEVDSRDAAIEATVQTYRVIGSPDHLDEDHIRELAGRAFDRSHNPAGRMRQLAAILAQPDRTSALRSLHVPTLIIHGLNDPLVTPSGGLALAKAIPGATFIGYSGMGHDLPHSKWHAITDDVLRLIAQNPDA
jgi:pimeloyl-ACP methyl ester carboxylesterase